MFFGSGGILRAEVLTTIWAGKAETSIWGQTFFLNIPKQRPIHEAFLKIKIDNLNVKQTSVKRVKNKTFLNGQLATAQNYTIYIYQLHTHITEF